MAPVFSTFSDDESICTLSPPPSPSKKRVYEDITSDEDEEDLPKKRCEEDLPKKRCSAEIVICQPDLDLPVEDQDIVYLGTYNTTKICQPDEDIPAEDEDIVYLGTYKKTSPRAPPNTPTYPSISAASNIWLEGTSVHPVQVCLVILSYIIVYYISKYFQVVQIAEEMAKLLHPLIHNSTSQIKKTLSGIQEKQEEDWTTAITNLNTGMNMLTESLQTIQTKIALIEVELSTINLKQKLKNQASMDLLSKIDSL